MNVLHIFKTNKIIKFKISSKRSKDHYRETNLIHMIHLENKTD